MSKVAATVLMSASTLTNPTTPKALSFDASAFVTTNNQIRVAVQKNTELPVVVMLRNKSHEVLFRQNISKNELRYAVKLDVNELADGQYEIEVRSSEGSIVKEVTLKTAPIQQTSRIVAMQ
ncbi:hypothetical protein GO755_11180 [Spirosoma sp. HMF4905]|uniref:DUF3244 domain-containing protein n=2 Tax=Spirosoma arboris TaxID=2682092 RepID=A0A7K1SAM9_9BACT|nr:hypothetical protein [Spirosoma arboris]